MTTSNPKENTLYVRITPEMKEWFEKEANKQGMGTSTFCRSILMQHYQKMQTNQHTKNVQLEDVIGDVKQLINAYCSDIKIKKQRFRKNTLEYRIECKNPNLARWIAVLEQSKDGQPSSKKETLANVRKQLEEMFKVRKSDTVLVCRNDC